MIYAYCEEQRSFPEYVDMVFKDLYYSPDERDGRLPLSDWNELYDLITDGYFVDFGFIPKDVNWVLVDELLPQKKRRVKKWCKRMFEQYGEHEKANKIIREYDEKWKAEYKIETGEDWIDD